MPFKSEKQRRYLWANEPEIARDWTNTYGHRTRGDSGGIMQGGVQNYLGNQKMVEAPLHWQSAPDHPITELAYITKKEKDLLIKKDLHKSLKGGVNRGPSGIMSLNGWGSSDAAENRAGADITASMDRSGSDSGWSPSSGGGGSSAVAAQTISPAQLQLMHEQKGGSTVLPESTFGRTYQQPRRGIGGFFSGLGRGIGKMAMMFNPWTAAAGIMGNPKTAAFLNLMGRGKNKLQNIGGDVGEISNYPTLDRWLNRNTGKYDDKPYQGQGQGYDFKTDNLQTAIDRDLLNDPEQLYLQNPSKNYLSSIDLSKYDNAPPFMHDLEAKAPTKKREQDFDLNDPSTWYDTHPATGESVMTPGFKKHYQGPNKLNPRHVADSYEYMEERNPFQAEVWQRPHTFGQEHEWYSSNQPEIDEGIDPNMDPMTFAQRDDLSGIEGHQAKLGKLPLIQMRILEKKVKAPGIYGKPTPKEEEQYKKLKKMMESETMYSLPLIG